MATVDEVFAMSAGEKPHIVINSDRSITVPNELINIAVQYDHDIESLIFDCPRYWNGHDLSTMKIVINYKRPDGSEGTHECTDVKVDDGDNNTIHFVWTIRYSATYQSGTITFIVCAQDIKSGSTVERIWHSQLCDRCRVLPGMKCTNADDDDHVFIPDNFEGIPAYSDDDIGKFLRINSNGELEWQTVMDAEGVSV